MFVWSSSIASWSCGSMGWACILSKTVWDDKDAFLSVGRSSPQAERRNRMCLQEDTLSGQLQVIEDVATVMTYAFPVDPRTMKMQLTCVFIMWNVWVEDRWSLPLSQLMLIIYGRRCSVMEVGHVDGWIEALWEIVRTEAGMIDELQNLVSVSNVDGNSRWIANKYRWNGIAPTVTLLRKKRLGWEKGRWLEKGGLSLKTSPNWRNRKQSISWFGIGWHSWFGNTWCWESTDQMLVWKTSTGQTSCVILVVMGPHSWNWRKVVDLIESVAKWKTGNHAVHFLV